MSVKIHAYIAHTGLTSRRKAEELVATGQVTVNGQLATIGQRIDPNRDQVKVQGKSLTATPAEFEYWLINKPPGIVSSVQDELGRSTVVSLIPKTATRVYPVGRLDRDSEGLMLLTNDGDVAYRLTHPKYEVAKTYQVLIDREPTSKALDFLRKGVRLHEGMVKATNVEVLDREQGKVWLEMTIHEGRYHQVKRMLERAGYDTLRLIRVAMGPLQLEEVGPKVYRRLSREEATFLRTELGLAPLS